MTDLGQLRQRLVADASLLTAANILARLLSAITLIIITRLLGRDAYGQYAAALALTRIASVLFNLGLDGWLLRSGRWHRDTLQQNTTAILLIKLVLGVVWLLGLLGVTQFLNWEAFPPLLVLLAATSTWLEEFAATAIAAAQASLRNQIAAAITVGTQLLLLLALGVLLLIQASTTEMYMVGRLGATLIAGLTAVWGLRHLFGLQFSRKAVQQALTETPMFALSLGLALLSHQADVVIVANWLGKAAAGVYAPAITIASTLFLLSTSIYNVLLPLFSRLYENEGKYQIVTAVRQFIRYTFILSSVMTLSLALTARWIVWLAYGNEYAQSGQILTIFSLVLFSRSFIVVGAAVLTAVGWQKQRVIVQIIATTLNILLNLLIVTQTSWGLWGVAWVYVLSEAVAMLGYWYYVWQWGQQT